MVDAIDSKAMEMPAVSQTKNTEMNTLEVQPEVKTDQLIIGGDSGYSS